MLALSLYQWLKALHVVAATVWAGGVVFVVALVAVAFHFGDPRAALAIAPHAKRVGDRVLIPAALVTLGLGIALVEHLDIDWSQFWVVYGVVAWCAAVGRSLLFATPNVRKLTAARTAGRSPDDPELHATVKRLLLFVAGADALILVSAVFVMTAKPFS